MIVIIILIIGFVIYKVSSSNNVPSYKHNSSYINLVSEDKLQIDLTACIEVIVSSSLKNSKERGYSSETTNKYLIYDINSFREESSKNAFEIASKYRISVNTTVSVINSICDGAIGTYVFNF